jgi:hypothetical protein
MGNARSCVVCTDGAPDVQRKRWGIGLTFSFHADALGLDGHPIYFTEDSWSGWNCNNTFIQDGRRLPLWALENDIAVAETIALARAFWCIAEWVRPPMVPIVVSDRVASLRNLETRNGKPIASAEKSTETRFRYAFAYTLRMLRIELVKALQVHKTIRVFYLEDRGFDANWRPDFLSRSGTDDCHLPEANHDPYWVRINFNVENVRRRMNRAGMILEQVLGLEE